MHRPEGWVNPYKKQDGGIVALAFTSKDVQPLVADAFEAGADAILEGLTGDCEYSKYITQDSFPWVQIPKLTGSKGWLVFIPEEEE